MTRAAAFILFVATCTTALQTGCGAFVPEYRIEVQDVPAGTARLQVATYVNDALAVDSPTVNVQGPRDRFTFAVNLTGPLQGANAILSVAALDANNCLLAVGTSGYIRASDSGTDVPILLIAPNPALAMTDCRSPSLTILAVIRSMQGPLGEIDDHLQIHLQGWNFQPRAEVEVRSARIVDCNRDPACEARCPGTVQGSMALRTSCALVADVVHSGPALIELSFDAKKNELRAGLSVIVLFLFVDRTALTFTVRNPDPAGMTTFAEKPVLLTTS